MSIDWSALLSNGQLWYVLLGALAIILPQWSDQIEKLKALFGKGETAAMKLARLEPMANKLIAENDRLVNRMSNMSVASASVMKSTVPDDPKAEVNASLQALTDHFVTNANPTGVEAMKTAWSEINKVQAG